MRRALELARETAGLASPNPQVGCVLVRDGQILGEGAHLYDRFDHAEIAALKQAQAAGHQVAGATAYVTLEPCSHHGRTGPCADALLAAGIARCVVATADPNPQVSGRGLNKLRAAGVQVDVGLLQEEARALNHAFAFSIVHLRPFVTLKAGLSVDGRLAPAATLRPPAAEPFFLTGHASRSEVQRMRHNSDAILTGIGTVLADDPLLTDRSGLPRRRPLLRIVLDSTLRIPLEARLVASCKQDLWIFCNQAAPPEREAALCARGVRVTRLAAAGALDLGAVLAALHEARILSVLLEAGSALNAAFLRAHLVDRAVLFYAEAELGSHSIPFAADLTSSFALEQRLTQLEKRPFGPDVCVSGLLHDPWAGIASATLASAPSSSIV